MVDSSACPALVILSDGSSLHLSQTVREIPGRRLVCRATWHDRPVYAKLFTGAKAKRYAARDVNGARALAKAGIATPELLKESDSADGSRVLIFAAVEAPSAEDLFKGLSGDPSARLRLAERLVKTLAKHHSARLIQHDMYLKNFLVTAHEIFTLDGDGVRCYRRVPSRRKCLANLAMLLSKFDVQDDCWVPKLLQSYASLMAFQLDAGQTRKFSWSVVTQRMRVAHRYADCKVFRQCSDVMVTQGWFRFCAISRSWDSASLRNLLNVLPYKAGSREAVMLKQGRTCTIYRESVDARQVVIKRYNIKHWRHALRRLWRRSRAAVSWANSYRMRILGIATAEPIALVERRWGWLRLQAFFVMAYVDAPDAARFFLDPTITPQRKLCAARNISALLHKLGSLRLVHGDMKATNILVDQDDNPILLDLDAMYEASCAWVLKRGHAGDLSRWMQNWKNAPQVSELMRNALREVYGDDGLMGSLGPQ